MGIQVDGEPVLLPEGAQVVVDFDIGEASCCQLKHISTCHVHAA